MPTPVLRRPPAVARVLQRVTRTARTHQLFPPGSRVLVACSGGPDSLCLLHAMVRLRRLLGISVTCLHFDHGLRAGSAADAAYVRRQSARLRVPYVLRRARSRPGRGESVEAWARAERYAAIQEVLEELGGGVGTVGHTLDDQAETVLMALLRGGGIRALSGMSPRGAVARPLLEVTREETEAFCRSLGLRPRRDPMNADPDRLRVAMRSRLLPAAERTLGIDVKRAVARAAEHLAADESILWSLAEAARRGRPSWRSILGPQRPVLDEAGEEARLDASALRALPEALASRVVLAALYAHGVRVEDAHVEAVLDLAAGRPGRRAHLPGGLLAVRTREYVRLSRPSPAP